MKTMKIKITGIRPLILHNGLLADPTNPIVLQQKAITAKKAKKTDADNLELARLEWFGGLYLSEAGTSASHPTTLNAASNRVDKNSASGRMCKRVFSSRNLRSKSSIRILLEKRLRSFTEIRVSQFGKVLKSRQAESSALGR